VGVILITLWAGNADAKGIFKKKKKKDEVKKELKSELQKKMEECSVQSSGLFDLYHKDNKVYVLITPENIDKQYLFANRVSALSNNVDYSAGQMTLDPFIFYMTKDTSKVYLHRTNNSVLCDPESEVYSSFLKNNLSPIWKSFKIEAKNKAKDSLLVDMTDLFLSGDKELSPFRPMNLGDAMARHKTLSGSYVSDDSKVLSVKAFAKNIVVKTQQAYKVKDEPFMAVLTRNILALPEEPMRPRLHDDRIGYFRTSKMDFTDKGSEVQKYAFINKWNLQPKKEDLAKYKKGELVTPEKPIVFYVDTAIPKRFRDYIKLGVEDWKVAFEEIGFKDAIQAIDYPTKAENPDFDPDDARYSCYRFVTSKVQNSMGPSYVDPRTGEIICADVFFYQNLTKILHSWRLIQTSTVDPRVRKAVFDDEVMGECIRYVAAHEIGHTIGLMHNFGSSYAYPVDSLRSATFTQKYGTTPSIMDYARFNYVAQPGDEGVRLIPPLLGVYDKYALKWGYQPIYEAKTFDKEYDTLNQWILDAANNPMLKFGAQTMGSPINPANQSESLGNDPIKATRYGINNLKLLMKNLNKWTAEGTRDYTLMEETYEGMLMQMERYLVHTMTLIGGIYKEDIVRGDNQVQYHFVDKKTQKEAVKFIYDEIYHLPDWFYEKSVTDYIGLENSIEDVQVMALYRLMYSRCLSVLEKQSSLKVKGAYTAEEYLDDLYKLTFAKVYNHKKCNHVDRALQIAYFGEIYGIFKGGSSKAAFDETSLTTNYSEGGFTFNESRTERLGVDIHKFNQLLKLRNDLKALPQWVLNKNPHYKLMKFKLEQLLKDY
jgi:hypothetical protein